MAVVVRRDSISDQAAKYIREQLTIIGTDEKGTTIVALKKEGDLVRIPFFVGGIFFGLVNDEHQYPSCAMEFVGSLRPHQQSVEDEAWDHLQLKRCTTIALYTGFGKTVVGIKLSIRLGLLTLILVHRNVLAEQWKATVQKFTNGVPWVVGDPPPATANIIICMDTRCDLIPKEIRDSIGTLIVDEAHHFCTRTRVEAILTFQPKYVIVETATPTRDDGLYLIMQTVAGAHVITRKRVSNIGVIKIITPFQGERLPGRKGVNWAHLQETLLLRNEERNKYIVTLTQYVLSLQKKILILTSLQDHVKILVEMLRASSITVDYMSGTKKRYTDSPVLVGTISKIGTGFDEKTSCADFGGKTINAIIFVSSFKKETLITQTVGRGTRSDDLTVWHLVDDDPTIKSQWKCWMRYYKENNANVTEISLK